MNQLYILKKRENIMPKGSEQLTNARKEEIINACAKLYTTMNFKDITLKQISLETTFTRTSIYNYFQTKEEIFLALFQREYDLWTADIRQIFEKYEVMTVDKFASALAHTLEKRECLLKLLSMNHYDMESRSRLDNLVEFKKSYGNSMAAVTHCLEKFFPKMTIHDIQDFLYVFFPFLFGIYPYTYVTEKQTEQQIPIKSIYTNCPLLDTIQPPICPIGWLSVTCLVSSKQCICGLFSILFLNIF